MLYYCYCQTDHCRYYQTPIFLAEWFGFIITCTILNVIMTFFVTSHYGTSPCYCCQLRDVTLSSLSSKFCYDVTMGRFRDVTAWRIIAVTSQQAFVKCHISRMTSNGTWCRDSLNRTMPSLDDLMVWRHANDDVIYEHTDVSIMLSHIHIASCHNCHGTKHLHSLMVHSLPDRFVC